MNNKIKPFDIVFIIVAAVLCWYIIYMPPIHGIADQGDFERVMSPSGLAYANGKSSQPFYDFAQPVYKMQFVPKIQSLLYMLRLSMIIPSTSAIYPIGLAKLICRIFGGGYFFVPVLAFVMCVIFIFVCWNILRSFPFKTNVGRYLFSAAFLLIFFDGTSITAFNSLYGQSMMLLGLMMFILSCIMLIETRDNQKKRYLIFYCIACITLLGAKLQCIACLPFMIVVYLYLWKKCRFKTLLIGLCALTIWYGIGNYVINGMFLNIDTQYNSVFYGILKDSTDPEKDLEDLGLAPELAADAGKHAYLDKSEYKYVPRTTEMNKMFYSKMSNAKLMKFYLTHPIRFFNAMEITANNAFETSIDLGTYQKDSGIAAGTSDYRFDAWNNIRLRFPHTLMFIIPVYLIFIAIGVYEGVKKKNPYGLLFLTIILMGAVQFPMPYLGNGNADIVKQLYLFNLCFDIGILTTVYYVLKHVFRRILQK